MSVYITEFLETRIAEDEDIAKDAYARDVADIEGMPLAVSGVNSRSDEILWINPARVLAECKAKRNIMFIVAGIINDEAANRWIGNSNGELMLHALARVYADHLDFNPEWMAE